MISRILHIAVLASSFSQAWASCAYGTLLHPRAEEGAVEVKHFGYIGAKGPANWVALDPAANALCATGKNQSPINMVSGSFSVIPAAELSLSIPDIPEGTQFENLGTTIEVVTGVGSMSFRGVNYKMKQFHFHLPSEHLDNGTSMAMEMHMVWEGANGQIAVIGTFIDIDDNCQTAKDVHDDDDDDDYRSKAKSSEKPCPTSVARRASAQARNARRQASSGQSAERRALPSLSGSFFHVNAPSSSATTPSKLLETVLGSAQEIAVPGSHVKTQPLVLSELVNTLTSGTFQTYEGSLTTPPCSEGVRWLVSDQKLSIKTATFLKARSVIGFNSRFPQNTPGEPNVLALAKAA